MLNNVGAIIKIYLIVINNWMQKNEKLKEDEIFFKAIKKEKTQIMTKQKASANFVTIKSHYSQL